MLRSKVTECQPAKAEVPVSTGQQRNRHTASPKHAQPEVCTTEQLRTSEERFRLLFEHSADGVFLADATGHYLGVNRAGCELLGYSRAEILARNIADVIAPEERGRIGPEVARLAGGKVTQTEWRFVRKDGSVFIGEVVARQLPDGQLQAILRDVSEPKRVEAALRESEAKYRSLFNSIGDGFCIIQLLFDSAGKAQDYRFLEVNAAFEKHTGLVAASGKTIRELVPDQDAHWFETYGTVALTGQPKRFAAQGVALKRFFEVYAFRVGEPQERKVAALFRDVTERMRAEEALRQKEERLEADLAGMKRLYDLRAKLAEERDLNAALKQIAAAAAEFAKTNRVTVHLVGRDGHTLELAACFGYLEDSALINYYCRAQGCGLAWCSRERQTFEDLLADPAFAGTEDCRLALAEGIRAVQCTPMINRAGALVGVLNTQFAHPHRPSEAEMGLVDLLASSTADWLEHRRSEEALRDREERLRKLADNLPESAVYQVVLEPGDSMGRFTYLSAGIEKLTGVKVEEALKDAGKLYALILPDHLERLSQEEARCVRDLADFNIEVPMRRTDGQVSWMSIRSRPRRAAHGGVVWDGVLTDITERKLAEEELSRHRANLERLVVERTARLQELVGELEHFSYTITHDLKAPLRAMRGFAEMACQLCPDSQALPFLNKISSAAERMDALIRDALNYSQAVRQELPLEDIDTGALLRGILDSYPQFQGWKAQIRVEGPLPVVLGNEAGLTQCFSNMLGNAVKFVKPDQKPEIRVWAESPSARPGWTRIWVEDQGIGIPSEMQSRLFEMFSRGSRGYEGTGIGLALVRKVVQRMGGRVGAESQEGKGSRFWMELKSGVAQPVTERAPVVPGETKGGTVLYAEDEDHDATFMKMAFAAKGLESALRVVSDGRAAIGYLSGAGKYADRKEYPFPDVVLLDLNLPVVSGFEVLEWMRNHPDFSRTPVVVFSSSTREDDRARAQALGANDFVAKPSSGLDFGKVVDFLRADRLV